MLYASAVQKKCKSKMCSVLKKEVHLCRTYFLQNPYFSKFRLQQDQCCGRPLSCLDFEKQYVVAALQYVIVSLIEGVIYNESLATISKQYIIDQTAVQISLVHCNSSPLVVYFTRKNNEQSDNKLAVLFIEHKVIFTGNYGTNEVLLQEL